jgi:2-isopropylmalate synthase
MNRSTPERIDIYDTTLRDGTQGEGISLSAEDKLRVAKRLDALGVAFVEAGWPGSNPKDSEFFARARDRPWRTTLVAFGSTRRAETRVEDDAGLSALVEASTPACAIFGKSSPLHVTDVLRTTRDENLRMIEESVAYLVSRSRRVIYDAEHFFDGFTEDPVYALETVQAAARGGAEVVVLCDTNGGSLPWSVERIVRRVRRELPSTVVVGIHAHNDAGCATGNALAAVRAGAAHVQGTINGYGERCGNTDLCAVIPSLELKMGARCLPDGALRTLPHVAHFVAEVANVALDDRAPYVGHSAFAHKGGVHVAAMRRNPASYSHVDPALVGNQTRILVSELSGKASMLAKAEELGVVAHDDVLAHDGVRAGEVLAQIKSNEAIGFAFEAADASVALLFRRRAPDYVPLFRLIDYKVMVGRGEGETEAFSEATIKIEVDGEIVHTAAEGVGPVNALDAALRKALSPAYPAVMRVQLADYKVRILEGRLGTAAITRVLVDGGDGTRRWSTVGASANIIDASWQALADNIEYGLMVMEAA